MSNRKTVSDSSRNGILSNPDQNMREAGTAPVTPAGFRVQFVPRPNGPERLVCDAEILFPDDSPLAGMKLVGFNIWRSAEGEIYATFPSRAFGLATERRFFDYLRSQEGNAADGRRVKDWILEEYRISKAPQ